MGPENLRTTDGQSTLDSYRRPTQALGPSGQHAKATLTLALLTCSSVWAADVQPTEVGMADRFGRFGCPIRFHLVQTSGR